MAQISNQDLARWRDAQARAALAEREAAFARERLALTQELLRARYKLTGDDFIQASDGTIVRVEKAEAKKE